MARVSTHGAWSAWVGVLPAATWLVGDGGVARAPPMEGRGPARRVVSGPGMPGPAGEVSQRCGIGRAGAVMVRMSLQVVASDDRSQQAGFTARGGTSGEVAGGAPYSLQ
jgi:hypothetical protein